MGNALEYLVLLIEQGFDYADAEFKAAKKYAVPQNELRACYDEQ